MVSKCANPACSKDFHYLRDGRLFAFLVKHASEPCQDVPETICEQRPSQATVFFWLCRDCATRLTLHFDPCRGASVAPISQEPPAHEPRPSTRETALGLELCQGKQGAS